ncbi:transcriptional activator TAF-1-like [Amaranthus tricolor]|uniref:transcriptional activator TAF-1-like n=1 Tax=Amaranthus tricolor TaxID=29722 RepID=UPI002584F0D4|nr:transcriptional activator TAF-1-like [Amaranthus tricolor]
MYQNDKDKGFQILPSTLKNQPNNTYESQFSISSSNSNNKFLPNLHSYLPLHDLTSLNTTLDHTSSCNFNNRINPIIISSNDEPNKEQDEEQEIRRLKRMISNRESARRSRLRKRKQLENLQSQVLQLLSANHQLAEKLNLVMETNYELLQENSRLRDESICLRNELLISMKCDMGLDDNGVCTKATNQSHDNSPNSITCSMDVLH